MEHLIILLRGDLGRLPADAATCLNKEAPEIARMLDALRSKVEGCPDSDQPSTINTRLRRIHLNMPRRSD